MHATAREQREEGWIAHMDLGPFPPAPPYARPEFVSFPKISRLRRNVVITEKIDGSNAQVHVTPDDQIFAGSRNRWITPDDDNFGFARWVDENRDELLKLGHGTHYGEWWGCGIQRRYVIGEKRFSLFNVARWTDERRPACCHVVPTLYSGPFEDGIVENCLEELRRNGSKASPGFMNPEGVVIYHAASGDLFKVTIERDEEPKGKARP